ncbi:MAG: hypothetical protein ACRDD7_04685 [Peptostreptococcaceae bacterium]
MKNEKTLGELMGTMKVDLQLVNDYGSGSNNEVKTVECLLHMDTPEEEIKEYIEERYEMNLDDMWEIVKIYR